MVLPDDGVSAKIIRSTRLDLETPVRRERQGDGTRRDLMDTERTERLK